MLDILLFREERGYDPERIRESQRRRHGSVELVDEVIKLDQEWRKKQFDVEAKRKQVNQVQDGIKKKKMATGQAAKSGRQEEKVELEREAAELLAEKSRLEEEKAALETEVVECKAAMEAKLRLVGNLVHDSVPVDNDEVGFVASWRCFRWFSVLLADIIFCVSDIISIECQLVFTEVFTLNSCRFVVACKFYPHFLWSKRRCVRAGFCIEFYSLLTMGVSVEQVNNVVVRTWGTPRDEPGLVNHVDLVNKLGIVELEAGNMVWQSVAFSRRSCWACPAC
jgi:seryl-tRNA synthetase